MRSVLDYIARDLLERYCHPANIKDNVYFPIRTEKTSFEHVMRKYFLGLEINCKTAYDILESLQLYKPENIWLGYFNKITNEHKHQRLVPHKKIEKIERVHVKLNKGGVVSWNPNRCKFGDNVFVGGVPINPATQMPIPSDTQKVEIEIWVDFQFESTNDSSIALIRDCLFRIKKIYKDLKDKL